MVLICILYVIQGASLFSTSVVPFFKSFLLGMSQSFSFLEAGVVYIPMAFGGLISGLWVARFGENKGLYKLLAIGILCFLLGYYLLGVILITLFSQIGMFIFVIAHLVMGSAEVILISTLLGLIYFFFPRRLDVALMWFYFASALGGALSSFIFRPENLVSMVITIAVSFIIIFLLFDFFVVFPPFNEKKERRSLKGLGYVLGAMFFCGLYEPLLLNWTLHSLLGKSGVVSSGVNQMNVWAVTSFVVSRAFFAILLLKVPLRKLYWSVPFLMVCFSLVGALKPNNFSFFVIVFLYGAISPLLISFALKMIPGVPMRVSGKLIGVFICSYGLGMWLFEEYTWVGRIALDRHFELGVLLSLLILCFNLATLRRYGETKSSLQ